jgi:DNA-binding XRE family transcriptional regulator
MRLRTGVSQAAVARAIGVDRATICRMEAGNPNVADRTRARAGAVLGADFRLAIYPAGAPLIHDAAHARRDPGRRLTGCGWAAGVARTASNGTRPRSPVPCPSVPRRPGARAGAPSAAHSARGQICCMVRNDDAEALVVAPGRRRRGSKRRLEGEGSWAPVVAGAARARSAAWCATATQRLRAAARTGRLGGPPARPAHARREPPPRRRGLSIRCGWLCPGARRRAPGTRVSGRGSTRAARSGSPRCTANGRRRP